MAGLIVLAAVTLFGAFYAVFSWWRDKNFMTSPPRELQHLITETLTWDYRKINEPTHSGIVYDICNCSKVKVIWSAHEEDCLAMWISCPKDGGGGRFFKTARGTSEINDLLYLVAQYRDKKKRLGDCDVREVIKDTRV